MVDVAAANRRPLVIANWKMNGTLDSIRPLMGALCTGLTRHSPTAEVVICPPHVYLAELAANASAGIAFVLGAQDVSEFPEGAHTGEVSTAMLKDYNCRFVLVGHSERRQELQESDATISRKFSAALDAGLIPVLCVGERREDFEAGHTREVIARQLDAVLAQCGASAVRSGAIAYEPVWAIGSGHCATPEIAAGVHALIRKRLADVDAQAARTMRIVYGGSVTPDNIAGLLREDEIDGVLVGGASLKAGSFLSICSAT